MPTTLQGIEDVSKFPELVTETSHQGIENRVTESIVSTNMLRAWKEIDDAARLQAEGIQPVEDKLPWLKDSWG